ncbi:MAG: ABC transporter six-transmembrane domain-containing protein, partial [Rhodothermaceae bacterium]
MIKFSLGTIFTRFKSKILFTWSLVLLEALVFLLYPLFIGDAVDGLINNDKTGLLLFAGLGI